MRVSDEGGPGGMFGSWASRFFDAKQHQVGERERLGWRKGGIFFLYGMVWRLQLQHGSKHRYFCNNEATCANKAGQDKASTACRM